MNVESWDDLRLVLAVVEHQTLAGTARALGVDPSTVTRRLRACEARSGLKLFDRLRGGVSLTPAGRAFARAAQEVEDRLFALERELSVAHIELSPVRVTLSAPLAALWIDELIELADRQPELRLELVVDDDFRDLDRREADVALRRARNPPDHLVGRRVSDVADALYGAPQLLDRPLDALPWIGWEPDLADSALELARQQYSPDQSFTLYANSLVVLLDAARKGHTAVKLACVVGDADPGLVRLTEPVVGDRPLWVLTHPDLRRSPSVRLVMDFVANLVTSRREALLGRES
ncbi:MAG: LysR family transcriptional regulator [Myxococcota bacterium]